MLWWTLRKLKSDDIEKRRSAVTKLGDSGSTKAVQPLIDMLDCESAAVRRQAAEALGKIGDKRAVESLIVAINDIDPYVRQYSVKALGNIGDKRAVEPLILKLRHYDWEMRKNATAALEQIGDERAVEAIKAVKAFEMTQPLIDRGGESKRCSFCSGSGKNTRESGGVRFAGGKHRLYVEETCPNCNGTGFSKVPY